ncbi:MAG: pyrroline-5-carboxylate reductase [Myxococcota bacterium]|jgi:pyrroline-5-carboxylate reductase
MDTPAIGFVGAGTMALAIAKGLVAADICAPAQVLAGDPRAERREVFDALGMNSSAENTEVIRHSDVVILATKPQAFGRLLPELAKACDGVDAPLFISIAAGISIQSIERGLPGCRVIRCMPNTPAQVDAGATAIARGSNATDDDLAFAVRLFESVGIVEVLDESLLDAVTGLSGSGPAFVFVMIEALADAGVKMGLHRHTAQRLAAQTVYGAARLLIDTGEHPGRLKDMVASPGGTTIAGLHTLEAGGFRTTLINAVESATLRSAELGALLKTED